MLTLLNFAVENMDEKRVKNEDLISQVYTEKQIHFIDVINFFWKNRKLLLIVIGIAAVLAAIFSSPIFVKPKYKAVHILYPTTNNSISNALLMESTQKQKDPLEFGEDEEAEKAMQVLQSSTLLGRLVKNFNLIKHYDVNPKSATPKTDLDKKLKSNISFSRTRYLSVEITVLDESPKMAADLANGIAILYDSIKTEIQKQIAIPALKIVERALANKREQINQIKRRLQELGNLGVINYEEQSRALSEEIYKAQSAGKAARVVELKKEQAFLIANGGEYMALNELIQIEELKESDLIGQLDKRTVDVNETLSHKFTVSEAAPAEKKSWPVRWLVVLVTITAAFSVTILVLLIKQVFNK